MTHENYFIHNLETEKLNIHTTKEFYKNLSDEQRKAIKQFCLWSKTANCWVSKGKADNCYYLIGKLTEYGFVYLGTKGERLAFAEKIEREQVRAENRAERAEHSAEKADAKSDALYSYAKKMADIIPFGQPILVGHHSEKSDRNFRNKIHNTFGKAFAEMDKSTYYKEKAERARATADGSKYSNPGYLSNRIREVEKDLRKYQRGLKGKLYETSPEKEVSEETRTFYTKKIEVKTEELEFYKHCLETCGQEIFTKEKLKGKKFVRINNQWEEIVRLNPNTVSVYNSCYTDRETQAKWPLRYSYSHIKEAK